MTNTVFTEIGFPVERLRQLKPQDRDVFRKGRPVEELVVVAQELAMEFNRQCHVHGHRPSSYCGDTAHAAPSSGGIKA